MWENLTYVKIAEIIQFRHIALTRTVEIVHNSTFCLTSGYMCILPIISTFALRMSKEELKENGTMGLTIFLFFVSIFCIGVENVTYLVFALNPTEFPCINGPPEFCGPEAS